MWVIEGKFLSMMNEKYIFVVKITEWTDNKIILIVTQSSHMDALQKLIYDPS